MNKGWQKLIRSLHAKKYRKSEGLFFVEGEKSVVEVLQSPFTVKALFYTSEFGEKHGHLFLNVDCEKVLSKPGELVKAGTFQSNDQALAVLETKDWGFSGEINGLNLLLDDIRDPGNLGTIIRIADWYGVQHIFCSETTTDMYSPKVVSATKGSFTRVKVVYVDPFEWLKSLPQTVGVYGTFMEGENIHQATLSTPAVVVMGNESNGVSVGLESLVVKKLSIPRFGKAESLNVAVATAITCDHFLRQGG